MAGQRVRFAIWKLMAVIAVSALAFGSIFLMVTRDYMMASVVIFVVASAVALSIHFWICSLIDAANERQQRRDSEYWEWRRGR